MTFAPPARFVAYMGPGPDGQGVALWDVSHLLPRRGEWPRRDLEQVTRQYVHHSGILRIGDPYEHLRASARYSMRSRRSGRGWPSTGYHTWIPYYDVHDDDGNRVVYLCNPPERRTWHAGEGPNGSGLAHCLQGNTTQRKMSEAQFSALPVVLDYFARELAITGGVLGHFQAHDGNPKESCPGVSAESWVLGYQAGRESRRHGSPWS